MFLTKIEIDPTRRLARKYLGSPQVMHAVVMKATAGHDGGGSGRVLWTIWEQSGSDGESGHSRVAGAHPRLFAISGAA